MNITLPLVRGGDAVQVTLLDLEDNTVYSVSLAVYNYGGKGVSSRQIEVSTGE